MGKRIAKVLDIDGVVRENPDFPIAVIREKLDEKEAGNFEGTYVDPVFNDKVARNLYGRMMTLLEATIEPNRVKAVKDVFSKELKSWESDVYESANEMAGYYTGYDPTYSSMSKNIYQ